MNKLKVTFLGTPDFVQPIKEELAKHFQLVDSLEDADLGVVAAYGHILKNEALNAPKFGCINVHPSLLPKYRGPSPIQQALLNGDKETGVTIIKMDEQVDHGPILYQNSLELSDSDNFDTLSKKMFQLSTEVLPKIIEDFAAGKITPKSQDDTQTTFTKLITKEDGFFDINTPPSKEDLDKKIRAYYPWPSAWTKWHGKIVKFLPNQMIQMEGKKAIPLRDFLNGYPDFPLREIID